MRSFAKTALVAAAVLALLPGLALAGTAPVASSQNVSVVPNVEKLITLSITDSDTAASAMTVEIVTQPKRGTLQSYNSRYNVTTYPQRWYYKPDTGYQGQDFFTWKCRDDATWSNTATCSITVTNSAPVANNMSVSVTSGTAASIYLNVTHADNGQTMTYTLVGGPSHGVLSSPSNSSLWTYTSANGYVGSDSFTWKCSDGMATSNTATCSITVNGSIPVPCAQTAAVKKDVTTDIPALYTGGGGYTLTFVKTYGPSSSAGTVTVVGDKFRFVPKTGFVGTASFTWKITYSNASTPATSTATTTCTLKVMNDSGADWPMWRMDAQRSGATTHQLSANLYLQWRRDLPPVAYGFSDDDTRYEYCHEPVVLGKTMFIPSSRNDMILAVSTDTGSEKWRFYAEGPIRTAPAAYRLPSGQERLYVASDDGYLYCLDAATGTIVWKKLGGPSTRKCIGFDRLISAWPCMTSPIVSNGIVYFTAGLIHSEGVFIYALNAETGNTVWMNDSSLAHSGLTVLPDGVMPLGTSGNIERAAVGPSPQGYPVIRDNGTELLIPTGNDAPARYYLGTGALKMAMGTWDGAKGASGNPMWWDAGTTLAPLPARPTNITAGAKTYTATDAATLGVSGTVYTLIAADSKLFAVTSQGSIYCFGGTQVPNLPSLAFSATSLPVTNDSWTTAVGTMLSQSGISASGTGAGLVWGTGSGRLVEELVKQSALIVDAFDPSTVKCAALRGKLDSAGLYGAPGPAGVHEGSPMDHAFPPTLARLVAVEDLASSGFSSGMEFAKKLYRALRPNGGQGWIPTTSGQHADFVNWVNQAGLQEVTITRSGSWTVVKRTGVPGGLAAFAKPPFGILWFGRPSSTLHTSYSGGAAKCITLGGKDNDGTAPAGADPGSTLVNPLTGLIDVRSIMRGYGCAGYRDQGNLWVARSGVVGVYDKWRDSGTIHLVNARPTCSCTIWQYDDGTVFSYAPGCSCTYAFRGSFAFVPMTEEEVMEQWAWWGTEGAWSMERIEDAPVRRVGLNFGAISCHHEEKTGTLWIAYPRWAEDGPKMEVEFSPANPRRYYHHASRISGGDGPRWVAGSGVIGAESIRVGLTKKAVAERASGTPVVDGLLNDACWDGSSDIYMSHDGSYGKHESAVAYMRYDPTNLYVGLSRQGNYSGSSEAFNVYLSSRDTAHSNGGRIMKYLRYGLKADGTKIDALAISTQYWANPVEDHAWNGVWAGAVSVDASRFAAEMAIPWSEIAAQGIDRERLIVNMWGPGMTRVESLDQAGDLYLLPSNNGSCQHFIPVYFDAARGAIAVARPYKIRLHFAEIENVAAGGRIFDVKLQGQTALSNFDICAAAGGRNRSVVREFNVSILDRLDVSFVAKVGEPLICGIEVVNATATGANIPPVADAKAYPASGPAPLAVTLSAVDSYDLNDAHLAYRWDFGDGETGEGREVVHTYYEGGTYTAVLTVSDPAGATSTDLVQVVATGAGNKMPTCSITSPANGAAFAVPATVAIKATAADSDGTIAKVAFYQGSTKLGEDTANPYIWNWSNVGAGAYVLTAKATDNGGAVRTSAAVTITVGGAANTPPVISSFSPASPATVAAGSSQPFSVEAWDADGDALSYTWKLDGGTVGATGNSMTYSPIAADAGSHSIEVTVSDGRGGSVKQTWSVTVTASAVPPGIVTQPVSTTVAVGQTAAFIVAASGTAPLSCQWQKNGANVSGATSASYTMPAATIADNGAKFRCVVTNAAGSATSNEATLTVNKATPTITWATPVAITYGTALGSTQLNATASVPGTFVYTPAAGTVLSVGSHTLAADFTPTDTASYNTASKTVTLAVNSAAVAPSITTQPASKTVAVGATATFSVVASGTAPLSYQWQKNSVNISGATSASYTTPATTLADNGAKFKVVVTNSAGSVTSSEATLTVNALPTFTITASAGTGGTISPSGAVVVSQGASQSFAIAASGGYQISGVTVDGASVGAVSSYTFTNVTANHTIAASFSAVAVAPTITTQPASRTVAVGATATFTVVASGTAPLSYQWQKNSVNIGGATSASYATPATTLADNGAKFKVVVTNSAGSVTSAEATLTVTGGGTPGLVTLKALDQNGATPAGAQVQVRANSWESYTSYASGMQVQLVVGNTYQVRGWMPSIGGAERSVTITASTTEVSVPFWTTTLVARDQYGADVAGATVIVQFLGGESFAAGTMVSLPKDCTAYIRGRVPNIAGAGAYYKFTDGLTEVNPGFWTVTVQARDQNGADVAGATVLLRYVGGESFSPGAKATVPKGCSIEVRGRVPSVTGPMTKVAFTDGVTEVDPGFQSLTVRCRDQNGAVVAGGQAQLRYVGAEHYADGAVVAVPRAVAVSCRSRVANLYADGYESATFASGVDTYAAKFRAVTLKAVGADGVTPVPGAEIEIYGSGLARSANNTVQALPYPGTLRVLVWKDGAKIADVSGVAVTADTTEIVVATN